MLDKVAVGVEEMIWPVGETVTENGAVRRRGRQDIQRAPRE